MRRHGTWDMGVPKIMLTRCWLGLIERNLLGVKEIKSIKCWLRIGSANRVDHIWAIDQLTHLLNLSFANLDELKSRWCVVILILSKNNLTRKDLISKEFWREGGWRWKKWIRWRSDSPSIKQPNGGTERCQLCGLLDTTLGRDKKKMRDPKSALINQTNNMTTFQIKIA